MLLILDVPAVLNKIGKLNGTNSPERLISDGVVSFWCVFQTREVSGVREGFHHSLPTEGEAALYSARCGSTGNGNANQHGTWPDLTAQPKSTDGKAPSVQLLR